MNKWFTIQKIYPKTHSTSYAYTHPDIPIYEHDSVVWNIISSMEDVISSSSKFIVFPAEVTCYLLSIINTLIAVFTTVLVQLEKNTVYILKLSPLFFEFYILKFLWAGTKKLHFFLDFYHILALNV